LLEQWNERKCGDIDGWQPREINKPPNYQRMPIIMTQYAETNTLYNVTEMNRMVIQRAFRNGKNMCGTGI
jgi:poly(A) polymerase Pap1